MMLTRLNFFLLFISHTIGSKQFNLSHFIYPILTDTFHPQPSLFLTDVVKVISANERWKYEDVSVSKVETEKVRYGYMKRYEIEFMFGDDNKDYLFSMMEKVRKWKRLLFFKSGGGDDVVEEFEDLASGVSERSVVGVVRVEGPVELRVGGDDEFSLVMPWNASHTGLKRILVGEDVTVEVKNAQEVSVLQTSNIEQAERSIIAHMEQCNLWFLPCLTCKQLLPVRISGSASVVAFRTRNPSEYITSNLISHDVIELLPDKCYSRHTHEKQQCPIESLRSRIRLLEKVLKGFLGDGNNRNASGAKLKAKIEASTAFRFLKRLKPLAVKKIKPFVGVDSSAWSNLMANMSFTKLSSVLVAPEALTLDVNW
nr:hypothetical protein [Tanacetum cinerariifolium]